MKEKKTKNKLKIGINTLFFIPGKVGGTEIFLRNQVSELARLDKVNQYYIFTNKENHNIFSKLPKNFKKIKCGFKASNKFVRILWEQFNLPLLCLTNSVSILHSPGYTAPIFTHCKKITTIFDLNYYFHPEDSSKLQNLIYRVLIPLVAKTSEKIIVHSENSKKEFTEVLKIHPGKIEVIYPGVNSYFYKKFKESVVIKILSKFKVKKPFILSNAVSHPHKNLSSLIKAYSQLVHEHKIQEKLVLLGFRAKDQSRLDSLINELGIKDKVIFTGWVNHQETPYFYQAAEVFVFPSLYEGFGLPLIEAMASKVPLVASKYSCIPEVVSNGGVIVDTKKPRAIAKEIFKILKNSKRSRDISQKGFARSKYFSWKKFGKQMLGVYRSL